jgi:DNA-binding PadR family transcriptional regulator
MKDILPPLQFKVLDCLNKMNCKVHGYNLRKLLSEKGIKISGPTFYQLMTRLKKSKYIEDDYAKLQVNHQIFYGRVYKITRLGKALYKNTQKFYGNNK